MNTRIINIINEEIEKVHCPVIHKHHKIMKKVAEYNTFDDFMDNGGLTQHDLDKIAFGFSIEDVTKLWPSQLGILHKTDLEEVYVQIEKSGESKKHWAKKEDLSKPVEVMFQHGKFWLEDGHHRYVAATILGKELNVVVEMMDDAVKTIDPKLSFKQLMKCIYDQANGYK
jgi:hypothetical protein